MVQIVDHLGTIIVNDRKGNDQTLEQWYEDYLERNTLAYSSNDEVQHDTLDVEMYHKDFQDQEFDVELSNNLCGKCRNLAAGLALLLPHMEIGTGPSFAHQYSSFHEFDVLYQTGCHCCYLLMQLIKDDIMYFMKVERRLRHLGEGWAINLILSEELSSGGGWMMSINLPGIEVPMGIHRYNLTVSEVKDVFFSKEKVPISVSVATDNAANTALELAIQWLTACLGTHGDICNRHSDHQTPTRLIAVNENPIRLVKLGGSKATPRYTTLSHCWGNLGFMKLTSDSLDLFLEKIPVDKLTKTFQDAVYITQRLGIDYLWIDSLCIIQDSMEDWEVESFLMSSVYGGSTLNIAAGSAVDGSKGCFYELPTNGRKARLESTVDDCTIKYDLSSSYLYFDGMEAHNLGYRAWALQERLLAHRTIHFSQSGVFWECRSTDACDYFPEGLPEPCHPSEGSMRKGPLSRVWTRIVEHYSWTDLTYHSDRLVALSGIAKAAQSESNDQYVAGMWRKDLESQLCWTIFRTAPQRSSDYRLPTWSWASIDTDRMVGVIYSEVMADENNFTLLSHVSDVSLIPSGKNPFANLSSAYLKILCRGLLSGRFDDNKNSCWGGHLRSFELLELPGRDDQLLISLDCDEVIPAILYVLPLVKKTASKGGILAGLIIAPTAGPKGEFRRYGSFTKKFDKEDEEEVARFTAFLRVLGENGKVTAASVCIERESAQSEASDEKFVVTLI